MEYLQVFISGTFISTYIIGNLRMQTNKRGQKSGNIILSWVLKHELEGWGANPNKDPIKRKYCIQNFHPKKNKNSNTNFSVNVVL